MARSSWVALMVAAGLAGCGSDARLSAGAAAELHGQVDAARAAARDGDRAGALRALNRLDAGVRRAEADGELSGDDADALRRGVAQAKAQVRREVPAPAPTPATSETPAPTETATPPPATPTPEEGSRGEAAGTDKGPESGKGGGEGKGGDEGKGKGRGGGKGDGARGKGEGKGG